MLLNICESLLLDVRNNLKEDKRTNVELKNKLHQIFNDNLATYEKYAKLYDPKHPGSIFDKMQHEHYVIENYKKSVYGDAYEIQEFAY